ncbi:MAG: arsenate reductase ArsC [Candidatus Eisenbacteria bacterium]|nr:arsenate reductase ArsC [Candidatus Eisenbacteria bacterium]
MKRVLFVCTGNAARSQMAEGYLRTRYGDRYEALSGGTEPGTVRPLAVEAMRESGVDISSQRSKSVDEFLDADIDVVVTLCDQARESCPFFPGGGTREHRGFEDPAAAEGSRDERLDVFRRVRDEIMGWIDERFGEGI